MLARALARFGIWGYELVTLGILKYLQAFCDHEHDNAYVCPKHHKIDYIVHMHAQVGQVSLFIYISCC